VIGSGIEHDASVSTKTDARRAIQICRPGAEIAALFNTSVPLSTSGSIGILCGFGIEQG
jgi:hypothetical protein